MPLRHAAAHLQARLPCSALQLSARFARVVGWMNTIDRRSLQNELRPVSCNLVVLLAWAPYLPIQQALVVISGAVCMSRQRALLSGVTWLPAVLLPFGHAARSLARPAAYSALQLSA